MKFHSIKCSFIRIEGLEEGARDLKYRYLDDTSPRDTSPRVIAFLYNSV